MQHIVSISTESNLYCIVCYVLTSSVSDSMAISRRLEVVTFRYSCGIDCAKMEPGRVWPYTVFCQKVALSMTQDIKISVAFC